MRARLAMLVLALVAAAPALARAELLADVRARGTLKVGMAEFVPWMMKGADGKPIGLEVDIAERLAGDLGVQLEVVAMPFDSLIGRLAAREVDLVAANLSITPAPRAAGGVQRALQQLRDPPGDPPRQVPRRGHPRRAEHRGRHHRRRRRHHQRRDRRRPVPAGAGHRVRDPGRGREALVAGSIMALVASTPFPDLLVAADPDHLAILGDEPLRTTVEAFAVPQGEPVFLTFLNNWIDAVTAEGFVAASELDWFDAEDVPQPKATAP